MIGLNKTKVLLSFFAVTAMISAPFAQTGAAGVGTNSNNIVWLDAHAMGLSNGAGVSTCTDYSGNGNNFAQISSSLQPIYTTGALNGMPVMTYDGVDDVLTSGAISNLENSNLTYFIVFQRASLTSQMLISADYTSNSPKWRTYCNYNSNKVISAHYSSSIKHINYIDAGVPTFISHHITAANTKLYREGSLIGTNNAAYTTPTGLQNIGIGNLPVAGPNNYTLNGFIAEVIIYNSALTDLERIFIENYLGAKYGIAVTTDLYDYEATHQVELIGIGDDGSNTQTDAMGKGVVQFASPASMGTGEYLIAAHTDIALSDFNTTDLPATLPTHQRWNRTWRVDETGDVGAITLTFHLTGGNAFAETSSYRLLVDTDGTFSDATPSSGTYDSGTQTVAFTVDLADGDYFTLAGIEQNLEIHSVASTDWSDPNTWDCVCVPTANDQVYIDPFNNVTVDVDADCEYLSVEPNATLTMNTPVNLNIYTDWDIIGNLDFTDGSVSMIGSVAQYIDAGGESVELNDLILDNTSPDEVTIYEATYTLNGTLSPNNGSLVLDGGSANTFIVNSTSATTGGRIGPLINSFSISGDFTVRRSLAAGNSDWRNLCSPVIGATFDDWDPDLAMSGPGMPDGCAIDSVGYCFRSVLWHENSISNPVNNSTDEISNTRGYEVYVGDDLVSFSGTTLSQLGTLNTASDVVKSVNTGWWLIGNPYASPITFSSIQKTSQVGDYFYVFDAATGSYQWYDGSSNTSSVPEITAEGLIAIGQAVWVKVSSAGSLTFKQSDKTASDATFIRANDGADHAFYLTLSEDNSTYSCKMAIEANEATIDGFDESIDIENLSTGREKAPSLGVQLENEVLRKNYIADDSRSKSFDIYTKILNQGYYTISSENIGSVEEYSAVQLFDKQTGIFYDLKKGEIATFYSETGEFNRFVLILTNEEIEGAASIENYDISDISITQMDNVLNIQVEGHSEGNVEVSLVNSLGQKVDFIKQLNLVNGSNIVELPEDLRGFYIFTITNSSGELISKKLVL